MCELFECVSVSVCLCACMHACVCVTAVLKSTGLLCAVDSVVFRLFQICDSTKSWPTINICNISINVIRQNNYVSAACHGTKCDISHPLLVLHAMFTM